MPLSAIAPLARSHSCPALHYPDREQAGPLRRLKVARSESCPPATGVSRPARRVESAHFPARLRTVRQGKHSALQPPMIVRYRKMLAAAPVQCRMLDRERQLGITRLRYELYSQHWSPDERVQPVRWRHQLDIHVPDNPLPQRALLFINNGITYGAGSAPANEFYPGSLQHIALATRTVTLSLSDIPNQYLRYDYEQQGCLEDESVARSWHLYLEDPQRHPLLPLHIPMAAAVSQGIRVARVALSEWGVDKFILCGASKRGWVAWLAAIADPSVVAIVPLAMDLLNTRASLLHIQHSYGGNWPLAFYPYYQQQLDQQINTPAFCQLMAQEDPLMYLYDSYAARLGIAKYIVNASGDDFYVPDNSHLYYPQLPGNRCLRVVPNCDHRGILQHAQQAVTSFLLRFQQQRPLPVIHERREQQRLMVGFGEPPVALTRWRAKNRVTRDFRYSSGIRYRARALTIPESGQLALTLRAGSQGWRATFIEATFSDGFIATSQVYIVPDVYPQTAPDNTLPGRERFVHG